MLHFEYYSGAEGYDLAKALTNSGNTPYLRRKDVDDPLLILQEGYRNTFESVNNTGNQVNITIAMLKRVFTG